MLINFLLLFLSGTLLFRLSKTLNASTERALGNMCVYFLSFSVLFAFFPPVFSYDEPLQYCFIFLSLIAFVRKRWFAFVPFFMLALISRETSMLLLPALVCFAPGLNVQFKLFSRDQLRFCVPVLLPLLLYGLYIVIFISSQDQLRATRIEMASRFSCFLENFESTKNTMESLISLFLALLPFLYLVAFRIGKKKPPARQRGWIGAFLFTTVINTPIVILTAFARETRLFALPLLFIWPVFLQIFGQDVKLIFSIETYKVLTKWQYLLTSALAITAIYWFCFQAYPAWGLGENTFFGEYLFLINLFIVVHFLRRASKAS
jgi:hypothetical protein